MKKLVRDKIPDIVGDKAKFDILSNQDYRSLLRDKLVEEATEVKLSTTRANLVEELGDLEEVMRAILEDASINYEEMDSIRQSKVMQHGKFEGKHVMHLQDN
ncbi:nucleoside triphosphate pyrophosphohydrolase [Companilactobacillus allii]|uniref:Nucleotide pyrophosphohydrolase n=1 Tax=Companilactobacillus allii TaxID=1847728 RepID=A0A1P8Q0U1_9LACO|nr:nucleoside triphosphate pyrophosphohydrolase [Companilactobacillus allii]APX71493.1 nucleotide pyrophosphohydrolase [Companilactobacillus allii]USQ68574.1 nucleoside triphosphate pyrophosphohydrolase [Companilactobacillus allii]